MPKSKEKKGQEESAVLFVRGMPRELLAKMKAAAALNRQTLGQYVMEMFDTHVKELERKGQLPKGK